MRSFNLKTLITTMLLSSAVATGSIGCSTTKSVLAIEATEGERQPIHNPFGNYQLDGESRKDPYVVRTRKGDRSIEVELPSGYGEMSDFVVPVNPAFRDTERAGTGNDYLARKPSSTDREITSGFAQNGSPEDESSRTEIEQQLGVIPSERGTPESDRSYLAGIDQVKRLFRDSRFEAALLEVDDLLREYPTDPKLHEMRGTLLDRSGRTDLALRSWEQALRLNPGNASLRKFVERKQQKRSLASP